MNYKESLKALFDSMRTLPYGAALRASLICLALLVQQLPAGAQEQLPPPPPPTPSSAQDEQVDVIRLDTDLVQLRAVVTDKNGRLVDNLTKDDFEVLEDGKPQPISFFSVERVSADAPGPAGISTAQPRRDAPARSIVLFVDTLHMSNSSLVRVKRQLRKFVAEMMTDRDSVAIVTTSGTLGILQQFMSDRRMLRYAIDRITPFTRATTSFTPTLAASVIAGSEEAIRAALIIVDEEEGYKPPPGEVGKLAGEAYVRMRARDVLAEEDSLRRPTLKTFDAITERLSKMKGQRLMAFVSDGFTNIDREGGDDRFDFQRAVSRAARSGVVVYTLHAMGLVAIADRRTGIPSEAAQNNLRDIAGETGGRAFINTNDIGESLQKMLDGNKVYYSLAYYPPKGGDDRKYRTVTLRLKNHREYSVRTQKGYVVPEKRADEVAATPEEKLFKAMVSPLPLTTIDVISSAEFLEREGDDSQVTLRIHIDGAALKFEKRGEDYLLDCQIAAAVIGQTGDVADSFTDGFKMTLSGRQYEEARRSGFRYTKRLGLKPGLYQLRVGVREVGSDLMGTSTSWVEVPNLRAGRLALSSLFLGKTQGAAAEGGGMVKTAMAESPRQVPPRLILGPASFRSGEMAYYRFIAYNAQETAAVAASPPQNVAPSPDAQVKVDVVRDEELVHEGAWQPLVARSIRKDKKGVEAGGRLRLGLPPGFYTLRVTLKDGKSKKTVKQEIDFEVVE